MTELQVEYVWGDANSSVSFAELSSLCAMSASDLDELVEYGALLPLDVSQQDRFFSSTCISPLCAASKLRRDFELDIFAVSFLLEYLSRIQVLEDQVRLLKAHLSPQLIDELVQ